MIEIMQKKHLKKEELKVTITLYKEDSGCYRYTINQIYNRSGAIISNQNRDYTAGALKSNAIIVFEKAVERMKKKGYIDAN